MKYVQNKVLIIYLVILQLSIACFLIYPESSHRLLVKFGLLSQDPDSTSHYKEMLRFHLQMDENVPDEAILFIGDSITQSLVTSAVTPKSVNFGIGSDTTVGVLNRIALYRSVQSSAAIVLAIGVNDLKLRKNKQIIHNYKKIISLLPTDTPLLFSAIFPINENVRNDVWNNRIHALNKIMEAHCVSRVNCYFLNTGKKFLNEDSSIKQEYVMQDGIHLSNKGYDMWILDLKDTLSYILNIR